VFFCRRLLLTTAALAYGVLSQSAGRNNVFNDQGRKNESSNGKGKSKIDDSNGQHHKVTRSDMSPTVGLSTSGRRSSKTKRGDTAKTSMDKTTHASSSKTKGGERNGSRKSEKKKTSDSKKGKKGSGKRNDNDDDEISWLELLRPCQLLEEQFDGGVNCNIGLSMPLLSDIEVRFLVETVVPVCASGKTNDFVCAKPTYWGTINFDAELVSSTVAFINITVGQVVIGDVSLTALVCLDERRHRFRDLEATMSKLDASLFGPVYVTRSDKDSRGKGVRDKEGSGELVSWGVQGTRDSDQDAVLIDSIEKSDGGEGLQDWGAGGAMGPILSTDDRIGDDDDGIGNQRKADDDDVLNDDDSIANQTETGQRDDDDSVKKPAEAGQRTDPPTVAPSTHMPTLPPSTAFPTNMPIRTPSSNPSSAPTAHLPSAKPASISTFSPTAAPSDSFGSQENAPIRTPSSSSWSAPPVHLPTAQPASISTFSLTPAPSDFFGSQGDIPNAIPPANTPSSHPSTSSVPSQTSESHLPIEFCSCSVSIRDVKCQSCSPCVNGGFAFDCTNIVPSLKVDSSKCSNVDVITSLAGTGKTIEAKLPKFVRTLDPAYFH
jgi:hypothetical protein